MIMPEPVYSGPEIFRLFKEYYGRATGDEVLDFQLSNFNWLEYLTLRGYFETVGLRLGEGNCRGIQICWNAGTRWGSNVEFNRTLVFPLPKAPPDEPEPAALVVRAINGSNAGLCGVKTYNVVSPSASVVGVRVADEPWRYLAKQGYCGYLDQFKGLRPEKGRIERPDAYLERLARFCARALW